MTDTFRFDPDARLLRVGDRAFPAIDPWEKRVEEARKHIERNPDLGFDYQLFMWRGCVVRLENGWDVSIQWGTSAYGSNYPLGPGNMALPYDTMLDANEERFVSEPTLVECAVLHRGEAMAQFEDDSVAPYVCAAEVVRLIDYVASLGSDEDVGLVLIPDSVWRTVDEDAEPL